MKLEIDLDLNKIDYDAINKQIQEKIEKIDLENKYPLNVKIENKVVEETDKYVNNYLCCNKWGDLNVSSKQKIESKIDKTITELIHPHIKNIFEQIPQDELNKIISDMIPKILIDLISSQLKNMLSQYYFQAEETTRQLCENKFNELLGRHGY